MTSAETRQKAIELMKQALDNLNRENFSNDVRADILLDTVDTIMAMISDNGFELPMDVKGFIRDGKPLTPMQ